VGPLPYLLGLLVSSWFASQPVSFILASVGTGDLVVLKELIEANRVTPVIDRCYPLSEAAEAIRYLRAGHARGKVVVSLEHGDES
jgi:NADPH:quinone reductase-like Zn-dependent oxidoreductase